MEIKKEKEENYSKIISAEINHLIMKYLSIAKQRLSIHFPTNTQQ
jgi:hypothetical protein